MKIALANGLKTDIDKEIAYKEQMPGNASIITRDLRLIERSFYQFRKMTEFN